VCRAVDCRKSDPERVIGYCPHDIGRLRQADEAFVEVVAGERMLAHEAAERRVGRQPIRMHRTSGEVSHDPQLSPP
jgi:hypothetical protein